MIKNAQSMLSVLLHAPRGPFYSPKAARSRWEQSRKAILAFCRLAHRTLSGADFFPILAQPTVEDLEPLAHRTLSGAHRTVRCSHPTVGSATRHARIARPTVGAPDRVLTGQSGDALDSPVNYSHTLLTWFPRAVTSPQPTHRTVRWFIAVRRRRDPRAASWPDASLAHRTLSGASLDSPVHPDWAESWLIEPSLFQLYFLWF
jgi:hypothetical protein